MVDPVNIDNYRSPKEPRVSDAPLQHGGGGGTYDGMEPRIKRLEDDATEIRSDLKAIRIDLAEIKGAVAQMPTGKEFGELSGRVAALPTTAKIGTIVAIVVGVITLVLRWPEISKLFGP